MGAGGAPAAAGVVRRDDPARAAEMLAGVLRRSRDSRAAMLKTSPPA